MAKAQAEKYSFEPFGTLDGVLKGEPIRVFPTGKWYRDDRVLDLTPERLKEFSTNIKMGLPRFEAPINIEHDRSLGRYGSILDLEYIENGPDGTGLYATKYKLTPEGRKLVEQEKFKGVSGEAYWTLNNGAKYQDPKTGNLVDNVLVGMALTNSSFFGKDVAMYSATPPDKFMTGGELVYTLQLCIRACSTCLTACRSMTDPEADACAKACADCLVECQICLDACSGDASMPEMMAACKKCADVCQTCLTECLKCAVTADFDMAEICTKCAMACHECVEACQGNSEPDEEGEGMSTLAKVDTFKTYDTAQRAEMAKKGEALPNGSYPIADKGDLQNAIRAIGRGNTPHGMIKNHIIKRAKALGATDMLPAEWSGSTQEQATQQNLTEVDTMTDPVKTDPVAVIKPEEFAALKTKADQFAAQVELLSAENKKNAEMFAAEKKARRTDQLTAHYQGFSAIPAKADEFAVKMQGLEEKDVELFKYLDSLIATLNATIEKSSLFDQYASASATGSTDNFADAVEKELIKTFGGDREKYSDAMNKVAKERPELYTEYKHDVSASGKAA